MIRMLNKMDKTLLILTIIMFAFGLFMILDASSVRSFREYGESTKYFNKQLVVLIACAFIYLIIIITPLRRYKVPIKFVCGALVLVLFYLILKGVDTHDTKSWLYVGSFGVQPSEFAKVALIIFCSLYYQKNIKKLNKFIYAIIPLALGAIFTLLTLLQPDGGTGMILFFISCLLFYISPTPRKMKAQITFLGVCLLCVGLLGMLILGKSPTTELQRGRFNFKNPCARYQDSSSSGYQVCNSYIAINNGKLFSIRSGNSKQKYLYLPEAHTDFIFPIIVEDFGLIVGILIIIIYAVILIKILVIGNKSYNIQNQMICYGSACYIFLHVAINLVGVLGLLPLTGVPLPFISYGGSFALSITVAMAIVQRVSIENYNYMQKKVLKQ